MASRVQTVQVEDTFDGSTHTLQLQGVKKIDDNATNVGCTGIGSVCAQYSQIAPLTLQFFTFVILVLVCWQARQHGQLQAIL
jgi:hypothetical protein